MGQAGKGIHHRGAIVYEEPSVHIRNKLVLLLPSRSEQHEVLLFGSIQEGILQTRH